MEAGDRRRIRNIFIYLAAAALIIGLNPYYEAPLREALHTYAPTIYADIAFADGQPIEGSRIIDRALGALGAFIFLIPYFALGGMQWLIEAHRHAPLPVRIFDPAWPLAQIVAVAMTVSALAWSLIIPRGLFSVGLWEPFTKVTRPWTYRLYCSVRLWLELHGFGQRPTGAWASLPEVLACRYQPNDIFLGRPALPFFLGSLLRPIGLPSEKHVCIFGSPGSGKSTGGLMPALCLHEGSCLCIDAKGELAMNTAARRGQGGGGVKGLGQVVHVLDPYGVVPGWISSAYNVFDEMAHIAKTDPDRPVSYANAIADALVKRADHSNPYFDDNAHTLISGLILHVFHGPAETRSLLRVRELLVEGDKEKLAEHQAAGIAGQDASPFDTLLFDMANSVGPYQKAIRSAATPLLGMGPNQFGAVVSTAQEHTRFLDTPEIRRVLANAQGRSDFLLEDLRTAKTSIYVCMPINYVTGKEGRLLRALLMLFIDMMMRGKGERPSPPVLLAIDECPNLGRLDRLPVVGPVMRGYGVRLVVAAQDIDQYRAVYPECYESFIGNAQAVQVMGMTHPSTLEFLTQKLLPKHQVTEKTRDGREFKHIRDLLDPDQAGRLLAKRWNYQIVWRGDAKPMLLKICHYYKYLPYWYYDADPRYRESWTRRLWRFGRKRPIYGPGGLPVAAKRESRPEPMKTAAAAR